MKQIKTILACGLVLASVGFTTMVVAAGGTRDGKAVVRSMHGDVQYQLDGTGDFKKARTNMEFGPKTVLKSAEGAEAYLQVNGYTSTVKLSEKTTITLAKMEQMGGIMGGDSTTNLKLDDGTAVGSVRKLSANSEYNVAVPNGVAGIRGTDFQVSVTYNGNSFTVVFTSVTGTVVCTVSPPAGTTSATQSLQTGQSWTVTGTVNNGVVTTTQISNVTSLTPAALNLLQQVIATAVTLVGSSGGPPAGNPTQQPPPNTGSDTGGTSGAGSSNTSGPS